MPFQIPEQPEEEERESAEAEAEKPLKLRVDDHIVWAKTWRDNSPKNSRGSDKDDDRTLKQLGNKCNPI